MKKFFYVSAFIFASVTFFDKTAYADACDDSIIHMKQLLNKNLDFVSSNIGILRKSFNSMEQLKANPNHPHAVELKKDIAKADEVSKLMENNTKAQIPIGEAFHDACKNADKQKMDSFKEFSRGNMEKLSSLFKSK
ncbi:MAG: hypothetical protein Q8L85_08325 [Alphaproteobacteria bacterium]|nr:hypothetical protein [Alphaproteobacteria bacterium]